MESLVEDVAGFPRDGGDSAELTMNQRRGVPSAVDCSSTRCDADVATLGSCLGRDELVFGGRIVSTARYVMIAYSIQETDSTRGRPLHISTTQKIPDCPGKVLTIKDFGDLLQLVGSSGPCFKLGHFKITGDFAAY